ncbi:MAG TPA: XdhC family protein [Chiayiivirga sp.]|nr:XdhC family protein [Chiayiivirga sp.]
MDEALFTRLAQRMDEGAAVVLASVIQTRGATPRKPGARMLVEADRIQFSVGGGAMEARVIAAARALLERADQNAELAIDLTGRPGSAGICGGSMRIALRRWQGVDDRTLARAIAGALAAGETLELPGEALGAQDAAPQRLRPRARLLILGAGHCGHALAELAERVDFEVWLADSRPECFPPGRYATATCIDASPASLHRATVTARDRYLVLLSRDYPTDVAALAALAGVDCAFLGMMGSRNRIAQVRAALPQHAAWLEGLVAPVGLAIGDETPHEIAVAILAQLIERRRARAG